jgi:glycosyltransferase involved in cell wall biosynthesis
MDKFKNKKICYISYHYLGNPNFRSSAVWTVLKKSYPELHFFFANWDHLKKKKINIETNEYTHKIEVPAYTKNLSLSRIFSHVIFSAKLFFQKPVWKSNIIVCSVPTNLPLLTLLVIKFFRPKVKIIVDIVDIWPEAIPLEKQKKHLFNIFVAPLWIRFRNIAYKKSNCLISHCEYFFKLIGTASLPPVTKHIPLCLMDKEDTRFRFSEISLQNEIRFLFLGSINNIFDKEKCVLFFEALLKIELRRTIYLEIIGGGEQLDTLLSKLKSKAPNLKIINHGFVFDRHAKDTILSQIHFGLNLYKDTTAIGISYKSIEYLASGIPIINSAKGDLRDLIQKEGIGFNLENQFTECAQQIGTLTDTDLKIFKEKALRLYNVRFSKKMFVENLTEAMNIF